MEQPEVITISQFKARCRAVMDKVNRTGRPIIVTYRGKPMARIAPPSPSDQKRSWLGSFRKTGRIVGDVITPVIDNDAWSVLNG